MAEEAKVPRSNALLQSITKLEDAEGWTHWKKEMRDFLILIDLYHYVEEPDLPAYPAPTANARLTHK